MTTKKYTFVIVLMLLASTAHAQPARMLPPAARPNVGVLPPLEYDRPYTGKLQIVRGDAFLMGKLCPKVPGQIVTLGCAYAGRDTCVIVMADDNIVADAGWSVEIVLCHEVGHCQFWPADHFGARPATPETMVQQR
jgi:hypothetical protein